MMRLICLLSPGKCVVQMPMCCGYNKNTLNIFPGGTLTNKLHMKIIAKNVIWSTNELYNMVLTIAQFKFNMK